MDLAIPANVHYYGRPDSLSLTRVLCACMDGQHYAEGWIANIGIVPGHEDVFAAILAWPKLLAALETLLAERPLCHTQVTAGGPAPRCGSCDWCIAEEAFSDATSAKGKAVSS